MLIGAYSFVVSIIHETRTLRKNTRCTWVLSILHTPVQKCPIDPGNNLPGLSSRYVYEANSDGRATLMNCSPYSRYQHPAWNHGTDTSSTLVNAIERYSPLDYTFCRYSFASRKRALNFGDAEDPAERQNSLTRAKQIR